MLIGFGLWRATLIARTEVHRTASWANEQTAMQMNIAGTIKEWVAVQDDRTRITHAVADGQRQNIEGKFQVGGDLLKYPGDPIGSPEETINCRCVVTYTTPDYFVNTQEEVMELIIGIIIGYVACLFGHNKIKKTVASIKDKLGWN